MQYSRGLRLLFAVVMLSLVGGIPAQRRRTRVPRFPVQQYVPGELLVKFSSVTRSLSAESNALVGAETVQQIDNDGLERVRLPEGLTVEAAIAVYNTLNGVEYAQPNFYYHRLATPNDPLFSQANMYGLFKIHAPEAWDLSTGSSSVVVADLDTGMRLDHEDLGANVWTNSREIPGNGVDDDSNGYVDDVYGWDFYFGDANPGDIDVDGMGHIFSGPHGSHTAGTIGAGGNNALGVTGINWAVKLMTVKIFNNIESPDDTTSSAMLVQAYNYVRMMKDRGVNVVATNNSYGGCSEACGYDQATKNAIDALGDAGVVNVFAAGNSNQNNDSFPSYPVSYTSPSIIGAAASDSNDTRASFSSYGLTTVDLAAPGVNILSTVPGGYANFSGTSMATPHVTGAVALLSAYHPELSAASLKASILNNVDVITPWSTMTANGLVPSLVKTGGRLNVYQAMLHPTVCTWSTAVDRIQVGPAAQDLTLNVTAPTNCDYRARSRLAWLTITGANAFSGNGTIPYHISQNTTGAPRSVGITFGNKRFIVTQGGA